MLRIKQTKKYKGLQFCKHHGDEMFDFEKFSQIARRVYTSTDCPYSIDEVLEVFRLYFSAYERYTGRSHPPVRAEQIKRIIDKMPQTGDFEVWPDDYESLIESHFHTQYRGGCDYNINHFFSGKIRETRYFEELY